MKQTDKTLFFRLVDEGSTHSSALTQAGYSFSTPASARAKASHLLRHRAPAQNAPLPEEEYETDPEHIRIWNHFLCREASGLISDTRHPQYGQPHPEGWTWESAMAETRRREASGDAPGWVGPKPLPPPQPVILEPHEYLAAGGAPALYQEYVQQIQTPPSVSKVSTVCPPQEQLSVGSDIGSWPTVDGTGLPPNCSEGSDGGLPLEFIRGLQQTAHLDAPVTEGIWTPEHGFQSREDLAELAFKIKHENDMGDGW